MKRSLLTLLLFCNIFIYAQTNFNSENYKVTRNDLEINIYEKDSTANALVIYEQGNSYFDDKDFILKTEFKHKIKILNREGFDKASISIHLYNNKNRKEKVEDIIATTYNLSDGTIATTKLKKLDIFNQKHDVNHTLIKFTLPNIKEGSVITYSYTLISPFMFKYQGWEFQDDIPKLYSEYKTSIPGNYDYNIKLVGGKKLVKVESKLKKNCLKVFNGGVADCSNSIYAMKDIPAFIDEDYMTSRSNYLARIDYELKTFKGFDGRISNYSKTWKTVDKEFRTDKEIGKQLKKNVNADEILNVEIINEVDELKKAEAIYKYVQENYTWNKKYRIFKDVSVKDLIKNKSGNVSSINILLHNLLKESNINVLPVLLSTRSNGFATKIYPVISDFNYLIAQVTINDKTYLLDATDKYLSFGGLPFRCLNSYGRLMDFKNGSKWIDIVPSTQSTVQYKADLKINENNSITGTINSKKTGYHALKSKKSYYSGTDSYVNDLEDNYPNIEITNHEVTSKDKTSLNFLENYNITYDPEDTGDNIYLNPFFIVFLNENPFKLQDRTYPIDFGYKKTFFYVTKLDFGDAYTVEEKPKDLKLTLPNNKGRILFSSVVQGNFIQLVLKFSLNDSIYAPEYYPYLKEFMSKIVDIQKNSLILLKKK